MISKREFNNLDEDWGWYYDTDEISNIKNLKNINLYKKPHINKYIDTIEEGSDEEYEYYMERKIDTEEEIITDEQSNKQKLETDYDSGFIIKVGSITALIFYVVFFVV